MTIMVALAYYALIVSAVLTILWLAWRLSGLPRLSCFRLNRALLIAIMALSIAAGALPFLPRPEAGSDYEASVAARVFFVESQAPAAADMSPETSSLVPDWRIIIAAIYLLGLIAGIVGVIVSVARTVVLIRNAVPASLDGVSVRIHDGEYLPPFAWGGKIVVSRADYDAERMALVIHEEAHRRGRHWVDLLLCRIVESLVWFCPTACMLRRSLVEVHEYEADDAVLLAGCEPVGYQMLLIEKASGRRFANSVADGLCNSSLKKRITMMQTPKNSRTGRLRALWLLPSLLLAVFLASMPALAVTQTQSSPALSVATDDASLAKAEMPAEAMRMMCEQLRYPRKAIEARRYGNAVIGLSIDENGEVTDVRLDKKSGSDVLDKEALRVARKLYATKFVPARADGHAVGVDNATLTISFRLSDTPKDASAPESYFDSVVVVGS